jgi:Carbohydrate binding domain
MVTTADPTVSLGATPAAGDVLILCSFTGSTADPAPSAVSGCGATWARIPGAHNYMTFWLGTGATASGTITATAAASTSGRSLRLFHLSGVQANVRAQQNFSAWPVRCTENQLIIGAGYAQSSTAGSSITATVPTFGWTTGTETVMVSSGRRWNTVHMVPHMAMDCTVTANAYSFLLVVGSPTPGTTIVKENPVFNSSFETTNTGWTSNGTVGTAASSAEQAWTGTKSLKFNATGAAPEVFENYGSAVIPVAPGKTYTASGYVYSATNARTAALVVRWVDVGGTVRQTDTSSGTALTANTWTRLTYTVTVPSTSPVSNFAAIGVKITDGVSGDICYVDAFQWEEGSSATAYWDGYSGDTYTFTGPGDIYQSIQTTTVPARVPVVQAVTTSALTTGADPTVTLADTPAAGDVLILFTAKGATSDTAITAVSGCGATWTKIAGGQQYMTFWMGTGATSSGTVTGTGTATTNGRVIRLFHLKNVSTDYFTQPHNANYPIRASTNQIVIGAGYSQTNAADSSLSVRTPATGWTAQTEVVHTSNTRRSNTAYSVPVYNQGHNIQGLAAYGLLLVVGCPSPSMKVVARNPLMNSSAETGNTAYTGANGSWAVSSAQAMFGAKSLILTAGQANAEVYHTNGEVMVPVQPSTSYTASVYVWGPATRNVSVTVRWYTGPQANISTSTSTATVLAGSIWTRLTYTVTSPSTAGWAVPGIIVTDSVNGDVFYVDGWQFNDGSSALDFFDGYSTATGYTNLFLGQSDLFPSVQMVPTVKLKNREAGAWVSRTAVPKVWTAGAWRIQRPKRWNGTAWVDLM